MVAEQQCGIDNLFSFFLFSPLFLGFNPTLSKLKGVILFCFCIKFDPQYFYFYLFCFESFFYLIFSFNFIPWCLVLIGFYIKFDSNFFIAIYFILNHFLNWFFFHFHCSTFGFILFLCEFFLRVLIYICFVLDSFLMEFIF
jgi:hypothetical protein